MNVHRGFSLLELSIVLVIIGLLTGGVLVGSDLIRSAEIKSITADHESLLASVGLFKERYSALPGDMRNATKYWGVQHADPATCEVTASTTKATCDGNGDGRIEMKSDTGIEGELYRTWQHLANAGFIKGSFTGVSHSSDLPHHTSEAGVNVPESQIRGAGFTLQYLGGLDNTVVFPNNYRHGMYFGMTELAAFTVTRGPALTPEEALLVDKKIDDGKPGTGFVMGAKQGASVTPNCATSTDALTAVYNISSTNRECSLIFDAGF